LRALGHYFLFLIPFYVPALSGFIVEIYDFIQLKFKNYPKAFAADFWLSGLFLPNLFCRFGDNSPGGCLSSRVRCSGCVHAFFRSFLYGRTNSC